MTQQDHYPPTQEPQPKRSATDWEPSMRSRSGGLTATLTDPKNRIKVYIGGGALAVLIAVAVVLLTSGGGGKPATVDAGALITTFLPGELQQVPDACTVVPSSTLQQYLPGKAKEVAPPLNGGSSSQCSWTLDQHPQYRLVDLSIQAYSPSGLASGTGSATFAAIDAYAEAQQAKQNPGPHSGQPKAKIANLSGIGNAGFTATQLFQAQGGSTKVVTEIVRYRNVVITVVVNDFVHNGHSSSESLTSAAGSIAQTVMGKLTS